MKSGCSADPTNDLCCADMFTCVCCIYYGTNTHTLKFMRIVYKLHFYNVYSSPCYDLCDIDVVLIIEKLLVRQNRSRFSHLCRTGIIVTNGRKSSTRCLFGKNRLESC